MAFAALGRLVELRRGALLHRHGAAYSGFYVLLEGAVEFSRMLPDGRQYVMPYVPPGQLFGLAILLGEEEDDEPGSWWYSCPCGCGHVGRLFVAVDRKPPQTPSWSWTGGKEAATLSPSVHHVGHWHGWLRAGVWESC